MTEPESKADLSRLKIDPSLRASVRENRSFPKWGIAIALVVIFLVAWWWLSSSRASEGEVAYSSKSSVPLVPTVSANASMPEPRVLNATGYVVAQRKAAVASKATGRLRELSVEEGDLVKADQILGVLENEDLESQIKEREASVRVLESRIVFSEAELRDARREMQRFESLRQSKVVSQSEADQALARFQKAESELVSARANLELAQAQFEGARISLSYTYIRAPFDGTVLSKNADVGEIVAPFGSSSNARAAIVTIADMNSLEVEADVSEANIQRVKVGQECEITLDSFPGRIYKGRVSKIVPTVDRAKATILTKIKFLDRDEKVIPEMSAKVAFKLE